jgi:hypothetical protein
MQSVPIENWWGPKLGVRVKILKLKSISQKNSLQTSPVPSHKISEHPECRILHCIDYCRFNKNNSVKPAVINTVQNTAKNSQ